MRNPDTIARTPDGRFDNDASHPEPAAGTLVRATSRNGLEGLTDTHRSALEVRRADLLQEAELAQNRFDAAEMHLLAHDLGRAYPDATHLFVAPMHDGASQVELYTEHGGVHKLGSVRPGGPTLADSDLASRLSLLAERSGSTFRSLLEGCDGDGVPIADLASARLKQMQQEYADRRKYEIADDQMVTDVVRKLVPDAVSWTVGTVEYDNGYFYDPGDVYAKNAAGEEIYVDMEDLPGSDEYDARQILEEAIVAMDERDRPLGRRSTHEVDIPPAT